MIRFVFPCGISRSGTTLLTTILDSHPAISMGYELMPADLPPTDEFVGLLNAAIDDTDGTPRKTGNRLKSQGHASAGVFVKRAARALVKPADLRDLLTSLAKEGVNALDDLDARTELSMRVVRAKMNREGTSIGGYKISPDMVGRYAETIPDSAFLFIVRDPRDVAASQIARAFARPIDEIARGWNHLARAAAEQEQRLPDRCATIQYEALVSDASEIMPRTCERIGMPFDEAMLHFFDSKASVHAPGQRHANAENLSRDFFTSSVGRWRQDLTQRDINTIERRCGDAMARVGYECPQIPVHVRIGARLLDVGRAVRRRASQR